MLNYVYLRPGRGHRSPVEMSQQAPFVDAATANDENNFANTFVSYYPYGAALGLVLDLQLRERGLTLDDYMKLVWARFGEREIPYHINDLETTLADLVNDTDWATNWFVRHVYHSELPPLAELLAPYGLDVELRHPDTAGFAGLRLRNHSNEDSGVMVTRKVLESNPLYQAGVDNGSVVIAINDMPIRNMDDWEKLKNELVVGQAYTVHFQQLGEEQKARFVAEEDTSFKIVIREEENRLRKKWLGM